MSVVVNKRVTATLNFPVTVPDFILYERGVLLKLAGNPNVPVPYPMLITSLATCIANCNALEAAAALMHTHAPGSKSARDTAHDVCKKDIRSIRGMVQQLADNNTSVTISSTTIITSAGFGVKVTSGSIARVFSVKNTAVSGTIKIFAPSILRSKGCHKWFLTADAVAFTGKVALPETTKSTTKVEALIVGTKYAFFHVAVRPTGVSTEEGPIFLTVI